MITVRFRNELGKPIDSLEKMLSESDAIEVKQVYGTFYTFKIIYFLKKVLAEIEFRGKFFPFLDEFFAIFNQSDDEYIKSKKIWNPFPPYDSWDE